MSSLPNTTAVWLAAGHGPGHRAGDGHDTVCGADMAGMIRTTLVAAGVAGVTWCRRCWPESATPGWPLHRR